MSLSEKEAADLFYSDKNSDPKEMASANTNGIEEVAPKQSDAVLTLLQQMMGKIESLEQKVKGIEQGNNHNVASISNTIQQQRNQLAQTQNPIYVSTPNELAYNPNQFNRRKIVNADGYYEPKDVVGMYSSSQHNSIRYDQEDSYLLNGFSVSVPSQGGRSETMVINDQFISIDSIKALFIDNTFITQWGPVQFMGLPSISHNGVVVAKYISGKWM